MLCTALKQWAHTITLTIHASENSKFVNHFHLKPISFSCQIDCRNVLKKIHVKVHVNLQGFSNKFNKSLSARLLIEWRLCHGNSFFFHTQLWFPASDCDFRRFESDFWCFCYHMKKTLWKKLNRSWNTWVCEFVFQRNHSLSLIISGIQTRLGEHFSAWVPIMHSLFLLSNPGPR